MAERFPRLEARHIEFIGQQHIYFVATAGAAGHVNVSPKGMDSLRVLNPAEVAWLNVTGSGNETATHVRENGRMTVMFCSFDRQPLILRVYGRARVVHPRDSEWDARSALFPPYTGARQVFILSVEMVQTSCGYAVPHMEFQEHRVTLNKWADNRGRAGIVEYWREKNTVSLDGSDTGIFDDL